MKRTTMGLYLVAVLLSTGMNRLLHAEQVVTGMDFLMADEEHQKWEVVHNGLAGALTVRGALFSSPCILETNEVSLPLPGTQGIQERYALKLDLKGCGNGVSESSMTSMTGRNKMMVVYSAMLMGEQKEPVKQEQRMVGTGRAILYDGTNRFTYYLSRAQQQTLVEDRKRRKTAMNLQDKNGLFRLCLYYE